MLEAPAPGEACPHGFAVGTAERLRASLEEWSSRPAQARCLWCGALVDLRPWVRPPTRPYAAE